MDIIAALKTNKGICPKWGIHVGVVGMYKKIDDNNWKFVRAECPIVKNGKLPFEKQKHELRLLRCNEPFSCPLYTEFHAFETSII